MFYKINCMTNLEKFVGEYQKEKNVLTNGQGLKLLIANRSNTSQTKTPLFLLDKSTPKGSYISSLYPLSDCEYRLDFKGVKYELKIDNNTNKAHIHQVKV